MPSGLGWLKVLVLARHFSLSTPLMMGRRLEMILKTTSEV
jgi:hypothetical protein